MAAKIITIFSSKGGVGKTFVTVNLGTTLAIAKRKVLLIDLDFQAGQDMGRMISLSPHKSIVEICQGEDLSDEKLRIDHFVSRHASGVCFIPAVRNAEQIPLLTPDSLRAFLAKSVAEYDFIFFINFCYYRIDT